MRAPISIISIIAATLLLGLFVVLFIVYYHKYSACKRSEKYSEGVADQTPGHQIFSASTS